MLTKILNKKEFFEGKIEKVLTLKIDSKELLKITREIKDNNLPLALSYFEFSEVLMELNREYYAYENTSNPDFLELCQIVFDRTEFFLIGDEIFRCETIFEIKNFNNTFIDKNPNCYNFMGYNYGVFDNKTMTFFNEIFDFIEESSIRKMKNLYIHNKTIKEECGV